MSHYNNRYNHWFWNSWLMIKFSQNLARFSSWIWHQQYDRRR